MHIDLPDRKKRITRFTLRRRTAAGEVPCRETAAQSSSGWRLGRRQIVFVPLLLAIVVAAVVLRTRSVRTDALREFSSGSIREIARWARAVEWTYFSVSSLAGEHKRVADSQWVSDHLILMTNGEWIVYFAESPESSRLLKSIFVGRASDGRWYYSTRDFGAGMRRLETQPASLTGFLKAYDFREFNGDPDAVLRPVRSKASQGSRSGPD